MIISRTPFRMSYVGGGTDLKSFFMEEPGAVVSTAINKYMFVNVHKKFDVGIRVAYSKTEEVKNVKDIEHPLVRESLKALSIDGGLEITSIADIPAKGTGLGSSSSYTVGLLNSLHKFLKKDISLHKLAEFACEIEIEKCKEPIGKQDQYAATFGGLNLFEFLPDDSVNVLPISITDYFKKKLNESTIVFYTGKTRSASNILKKQNINSKKTENKRSLRKMTNLAYQFKRDLENNDMLGLAELLKENWSLKKNLTKDISNSSVDDIYNTALNSGAIGGKLLGAGAGGFLMFLAPQEKHKKIKEALSNLRSFHFEIETLGSQIVYSDTYTQLTE